MPAAPLSTSRRRDFVDAAEVLLEVAGHERSLDPRRAAISASVAALVTACGRHVDTLPSDVAREALALVNAVDQAAGLHRYSS
ncbi:hypothetical protein ACQEVB_40870 [Pseudonocardia sp. CA-107938]|uniref:hypothetical protein n=1 Tax=Pseudonocardia sp. CA-107938 TaxID=3240021 RepID=UPI003D8E8A39